MKKSVAAAGAAGWMILIFCLSSVHGSHLGPSSHALDLVKKAGHFVIYGVLAVLYLSLVGRERPGRLMFLVSFLLAVLYGATDELHQSFVSGRHASLRDVMIDGLGALFFLSLRFILGKKRSAAIVGLKK